MRPTQGSPQFNLINLSIYFLAYKPGLFRKLRIGWRHEGRNTNMSRRRRLRRHRRLRDCTNTMPHDLVPLDNIINHWCLVLPGVSQGTLL